MKFLFINGVNLNMTGRREKGVYGTRTLGDINADISAHFAEDECLFYHKTSCGGR